MSNRWKLERLFPLSCVFNSSVDDFFFLSFERSPATPFTSLDREDGDNIGKTRREDPRVNEKEDPRPSPVSSRHARHQEKVKQDPQPPLDVILATSMLHA